MNTHAARLVLLIFGSAVLATLVLCFFLGLEDTHTLTDPLWIDFRKVVMFMAAHLVFGRSWALVGGWPFHDWVYSRCGWRSWARF